MPRCVVAFFVSNINKRRRWQPLLLSSSSQTEGKKRKHRNKKTVENKKNAKKGKSLPFFFRFYVWDEVLFLLCPFHIPSTLSFPISSSLLSRVSSKLWATQAQELSQALAMEWAGNEVREVGGGYERGMRGKFWGREEGWNIPGQGKRMCFWFIPKTASRASSRTGALVAVVHSSCLAVVEPLVVGWPLTSISVLQ